MKQHLRRNYLEIEIELDATKKREERTNQTLREELQNAAKERDELALSYQAEIQIERHEKLLREKKFESSIEEI